MFFDTLAPLNGLQGKIGFLCALINILQSFNIAFSSLRPNRWDNGYTDWITTVVDYLNLQTVFYRNETALYIYWALLIVFAVTFASARSMQMSSFREWSGLSLFSANTIILLFTTIGFLPLSSMLGSFLSCQAFDAATGSFVQVASCWEGNHVVIPLLSIGTFILLLGLMVIKDLFMLETAFYDNFMLCRAHGRPDAARDVTLGVLSFLIAALAPLLHTNETAFWMINVLSLLGCAIVAYIFTNYSAYYSNVVNLIYVLASASLVWSCTSLVLFEIVKAAGFEVVTFLYVGGALMVFGMYTAYQNRIRYLIETPIDRLSNAYEAGLKLRLILKQKNCFWTNEPNIINNSKITVDFNLYKEMDQLYLTAGKKFPTANIFPMCYGNFLFSMCNLNYCLTMFSKNKELIRDAMDVQYQVYKKAKFIEKLFSKQKGTSEVKKYFQFSDLSKETEIFQKKFFAKKLGFLNELKKPNPSTSKLQQYGVDLKELLDIIQRNYQIMISINSLPKVYRRYASFISNIVGYAELTKSLVDLADTLENDEKDIDYKSIALNSQRALFNERNGVFVLSGEDSNIGEILEVNIGAVDMFGFTVSSEMIGMNISSLMPSPFTEGHNSYLRKYLATGYALILDTSRVVTAKKKFGYIFQVELYVRQMVDTDGNIKFLGVMRPAFEEADLILMDPQGKLIGISEKIMSYFKLTDSGMTKEKILSHLRQLHISQLIDEWDTISTQAKTDQGIKYAKINHSMHIKAEVLKSDFVLLKIWADEVTDTRSHPKLHSNLELNELPAAQQNGASLLMRPYEGPSFSSPVATPAVEITGLVFAQSPLLTNDSPILKSNSINLSDSNILGTKIMGENTKNDNDGQSQTESQAGKLSLLVKKHDPVQEQEDQLLQNTAMNMSSKFDQLTDQYTSKSDERNAAVQNTYLQIIFNLFVLAFVISLIVANLVIKDQFDLMEGLTYALDHCGSLTFQMKRMSSHLRDAQFYGASDCIQNYGYNACAFVQNNSLTDYKLNDAKFLFEEASIMYRYAFEKFLDHIGSNSGEKFYYDRMKEQLAVPEFEVEFFRYQDKEVKKRVTFWDALNTFSAVTDTIVKSPSTPYFRPLISDTGVRMQNSSVVAQNRYAWLPVNDNLEQGYFNNTDPAFARAQYFLMKENVNYHKKLDKIMSSLLDVFENKVERFTSIITYAIFIPILILVFAVSSYIIPKIRLLINWEADILSILLRIPRPVATWWYKKLLKNLDDDPDDQAFSAELYLYLQQEDPSYLDENLSKKGGIPKDKTVKKTDETKPQSKQNESSQKSNISVSSKVAIRSIREKNVFLKISSFSFGLCIIPLLFLATYSQFLNTTNAHKQLSWVNDVISSMAEAHFEIRELAIHTLTGDEFGVVPHITVLASQLQKKISDSHRVFVYGDGEINGLSSNPFFQKVLFSDACAIVPKNNVIPKDQLNNEAIGISLLSPCESFMNGLLTNGLNGAIVTFEKEFEKAFSLLKSSNPEEYREEILNSIRLLERFTTQTANVILIARERVIDPIVSASRFSLTIIQPIQLVLAFLGTMFVYYYIYLPVTFRIEQEVRKMDSLLNLLLATYDGHNSNKKDSPTKAATAEKDDDSVKSPVLGQRRIEGQLPSQPSLPKNLMFNTYVNMLHTVEQDEDENAENPAAATNQAGEQKEASTQQ